jgi:hypothetical protein
MAAVSRSSKTGVPLLIQPLDPSHSRIFFVFDFDSICALYTIYFLDSGHTPRSEKAHNLLVSIC